MYEISICTTRDLRWCCLPNDRWRFGHRVGDQVEKCNSAKSGLNGKRKLPDSTSAM